MVLRLNVFPITIPPLRDRGNDVVALADYFASKFSNEMGVDVHRISTPAISMLLSYHWPGNVRELENAIERAIILAEDGVIHGYNLPPSLQTPVVSDDTAIGSLEARLNVMEYEIIVESLKATHGNTTEAAKQLGLTRRILGLRLDKDDRITRFFDNTKQSTDRKEKQCRTNITKEYRALWKGRISLP